jgi:hypothetical protein
MPRYVFIVTTGRTGSTLLANMLNAVPGVEIRGENFAFLYLQFKALAAIQLAKNHLGSESDQQSPFFGADKVDYAEIARNIADLCHAFVNAGHSTDTVVRGFKEVRYDIPDLEGYLQFLAAVCSPARFLFLLRDTEEIIASGFWKLSPPATARAKVAAMQGRFLAFAEHNPATSFTLDYTDLIKPGPVLESLFGWLDLPYLADAVSQVLSVPHSYDQTSVLFYGNNRLQIISRQVLRQHFESFGFARLATTDKGMVVVAGTLLPWASADPVSRLFVVPSGCFPEDGPATEAALGLQSPGVHRQFPENPHSEHARFRLYVDAGIGSADLYVECGDAQLKIGELTLSEAEDRVVYDVNVDFQAG